MWMKQLTEDEILNIENQYLKSYIKRIRPKELQGNALKIFLRRRDKTSLEAKTTGAIQKRWDNKGF